MRGGDPAGRGDRDRCVGEVDEGVGAGPVPELIEVGIGAALREAATGGRSALLFTYLFEQKMHRGKSMRTDLSS